MRRTITILSFFSIALFGILFTNQFLIMPWNGSDLPEMKDPKIIIKKNDRTLEVFDGDKLIKTYTIALGSQPIGDKEIEGDGKTPEGDFYIFTKNLNSKFYLSLGVSYPSTDDARRGLDGKLITQEEYDQIVSAINDKKIPLQNTKLGGEIYIHGSGNAVDWTQGCIAMKNSDMKELFDSINVKTPVSIIP